MFKRAQRKQAKLRLALMGPAGSGKTYSALKIAKGLGGRIAIIDTERGSAELYSNLFEYDAAQLEPPYSPDHYIHLLKSAEEASYDVIIVDSLSHAWAGDGGILDIHDRASKVTRNSFSAWREVTPKHNQLVDALLGCSSHLIVTMRTKTSYEVQQENGKTKVVKVGLSPIQRDGLEYEFTVVLDLSIDGHMANATKDRTSLFDGNYFTPSEDTGARLLTWLNTGIEELAAPPKPQQQNDEPLPFLLDQIMKMLDQIGLGSHRYLYEVYVANRYGVTSLLELSTKQSTEQLVMLRQIKSKEGKLNQFIDVLMQQKIAA